MPPAGFESAIPSRQRSRTYALDRVAAEIRCFPPLSFWTRLQNCGKRLLAPSCLSVRMQQLGSHWTDFHEIWYLSILQKSVGKIQVSLKSEINNGQLTRRPMYIFSISRSVLPRMKRSLRQMLQRKSKHFFTFNGFLNRTFYKMPVPLAARSKAQVCGRSLTGIVGSNPT